MLDNKPVGQLKNIGKTVASRLNEIGVFSKKELANIGAAKAYCWMKSNYPSTTLPVCYYLYSLEGALTDTHWNDIPESTKKKLREQIKFNNKT